MTRLGLRLFAALCGFPLFAQLGAAATLIVTTTTDNGPGSLRAAIAAASNGDTIQFDATLNGQTISLTGGRLVIDKDITINGPGPNLLTVSRVSTAERFPIFAIFPGRTVTIAGLTISGGYGDGGGPGGISNGATLMISNCIVSGNFSDGGLGGGGIGNFGTLTIVDSVVRNNRAGFTTGNPFGYGGGIYTSGTLTIMDSTISNNLADLDGGGILGGGIITITDSIISGNRGGSGTLPETGRGGGLNVGGTVEIRNSTISGNIAMGNGSGSGGGILTAESSGGSVAIINCTISDNFALQSGGGILNGGPLTITNTTLSDNRASAGGGIFNDDSNAMLDIGNTILRAGTSGANIFNNGGTITSRGYNLSSDNGGGFLTAPGDQINTNPILGPLQDNGGPTFTHLPQTGSPAIDAGDPNFTPPPFNDQRGAPYLRVSNGRIDIGAVELQPAPPTPSPTATASATPSVTPIATPSATASPSGSPTPTATASATPSATPIATPSATASPSGGPSPTPTGTPAASPTPSSTPARALNMSTRLRVETGERVMIGGFIVTGTVTKDVVIRGLGPSLAGSGISDLLSDPTLELRSANGSLLSQNDNWQDDQAQAAQLTSLGLAPQNPNESGIVTTLQPGAYTAILAGKNGSTGVGLVEIYDVNPTVNSQLANISTRGFVQTGDDVMIGGFILGGSNQNTAIAIRGIGPSLAQFGLSNLLADPALELRDSNGALLISNDDWQDDPASAGQMSARGLAPQNPKESGIFATLPAGAFTAILAGTSSGTGIGLVEIYNVQ